ncbi:MAG: hypothetical protein ABS948_16090 [Solibacillus sp.]
MKHTTLLYIIICLMQFAILTNFTVLNSEWNGITMMICTGLFIVASAVFGVSRQKKQ